MKVLCLHGWKTSAVVLERQLKLSGTLDGLPEVRFACLNGGARAAGPHSEAVRLLDEGPYYEWWDAQRRGEATVYIGLRQSERAVLAALADPAIEAVLGFSQGAAMARHMAARLPPDIASRIKAWIFISGIVPRTLVPGSNMIDEELPSGGDSTGTYPTAEVSGAAATGEPSSGVPPRVGEPPGDTTPNHNPLNKNTDEDAALTARTTASVDENPGPLTDYLTTKSLHIYATNDLLAPQSARLARSCAAPQKILHEQGHKLPVFTPAMRALWLETLGLPDARAP